MNTSPQKRLTASKTSLFHVGLITCVGLIAYANSLQAPFSFDDESNIVNYRYIKDLRYFIEFPDDPSFRIRYFGFLTFALNYALHGLDVVGYHIVNLLIHLITASLVYRLVVLSYRTPFLSQSVLREKAPLIALCAALFFVSHPIQTQAVTYVIQRFASLASMLYLLSLVMYVRWRLCRISPPSDIGAGAVPLRKGDNAWMWYVGSLIAAVLAALTKEIAFTLPLVLLLYEAFFLAGDTRRRIISLVPFLLTMLIVPVMYLFIAHPGTTVADLDRVLDQAVVKVSRLDYLFTQFRVIVTYLRLLLWPVGLTLDHDYPIYHSLFDPPVILSLLLHLALVALGFLLLFRSRRSDPSLRLIAFAIFWFFLTLSVESSIIPLAPIFEHRLYLPSIGAFTGFVTSLFLLAGSRRPAGSLPFKAVTAALILIVPLLATVTFLRNEIWREPVTFWEDVVKKSPNKARPRNNLAVLYRETGKPEQALAQVRQALSLDPGYLDAYLNLAGISIVTGRHREAESALKRALSLNPLWGPTNYNIGILYSQQGLADDAAKAFQTALANNQAWNDAPWVVDAHINLGMLYAGSGRYDEAIRQLQAALELNPGSVEALNNLAGVYVALGRYQEALAVLNVVLRLQPDLVDARHNIEYVRSLIKDRP